MKNTHKQTNILIKKKEENNKRKWKQYASQNSFRVHRNNRVHKKKKKK